MRKILLALLVMFSADAFAGGAIVVGKKGPGSNTFPSTMDDATATRIGLKVYTHTTAYNGGNAPTITATSAGLNSVSSRFMPYQVQDGSWRLRFTVDYNFSPGTTNADLFISGLTPVGSDQSIAVSSDNASMVYGRMIGGSIVSKSVGGVTGYHASGDIALGAKPSWAY